MDLGFCEDRILSKGGAASMFEATKSWKGGFSMKKTYQEPVTEIVEINTVDTAATDSIPAYGPDGRDGLGNYHG